VPVHLTPEELQTLCEGQIADEKRLRTVLRHLAGGCTKCRAALPEPDRLLLDQALEGIFLSPAEEGSSLEDAIGRAYRAALRHDRHLQRQRKAGVRKVLSLLETKGIEAVERAWRPLGDLAVFEALSEKTWSLRHEDPPQMLLFAREALKAAKRLDAVRYGPRPVADWQARAWAELGNACRVADQLGEARACFERAINLVDLGTGDPGLKICLFDLQASLAADLGEFREACWALTFVHQYHLGRGDLHLAGRALISKGIYTGYAGHRDGALKLLQEGLLMVTEEREPSLVLSAVHAQLWFLVESGEFNDAKRFHLQHSRLFLATVGKLNGLRLTWLMARTYAGLDELGAEERFREVKAGFEEIGRPYDAALASLDLVSLLISRKRVREARELLRGAAQTFKNLGVERWSRVALLLGQAAEVEQVELMHRIVLEATAFLRRAGYDPNARFEPDWWPPDPR
jgi:tetratricopeptide (TPR) repeat protein